MSKTRPVFDKRAGVTALVLLLATAAVQLCLIPGAAEPSALAFGFPFAFVSLTVPAAAQGMTFLSALGQQTGWALYPLSLLVDLGIWFFVYFLAAAVGLPLLHRK